ncbi:MAG: hypothetical protein MUC79_09465 [Thiobacillaceae bacterium]|jgi:hypothetical protein|nr:hypothetical protein [Thiobacillaceae bacterium]
MDTHSPIPRRCSPRPSRGRERRQARPREGRDEAMLPRHAAGRQAVAPHCRARFAWPFDEQDAMY